MNTQQQSLRSDLRNELSAHVDVDALNENEIRCLLDDAERQVCKRGVSTTREACRHAIELNRSAIYEHVKVRDAA